MALGRAAGRAPAWSLVWWSVRMGHWVGRGKEASVTTNSADEGVSGRRRRRESLAERARREGVRPVESLDDMASDVFASDEEVDEFIEFVHAERQAGLR
jgi:hypothetical protein